ncbi:MAG TPA: hypothetical protein VF593_01730 [Chthoniobacteraceae bacterium]|jgi:hypothetical protein
MKIRAWFAVMGLLTLGARSEAVDPRNRADHGQFTIYCDDLRLRSQAASFAAQTKDQVLALLGEPDGWKRPIVVTLESAAATTTGQTPTVLRLVESPVGMRIEVVARIGNHPGDVHLQKHLIRAVLLELMYRKDGVRAGATYAEPPWWLIEGAIQIFRRKDSGTDTDLFGKLVETNKLPPIENFLAQKPDELGATALAMDHALAMCLVQLLVEQPNGRNHLAALLRSWPEESGDPVTALTKHFPALSGGAGALQKWWTLNLARFAALNRHQSLSAIETDREIARLLEFAVQPAKSKETRHFAIHEFAEYLKIPESREALAANRNALIGLSARANMLFRPILREYEETLALLERGKTRGIGARLEKTDRLRAVILQRVSEISDYLNWFEATQMNSRSNAFDDYLKTANELSEEEKKRRDPIGRYLDQLEKEY